MDASGGTAIAQMPLNGKSLWLQIDVNNNDEMYTLTVVEETTMEQQVEFSAMDLASALAPLGQVLKEDADLKLEIQGHTDNVGQAAANLKLSQDRAAAVKAYLVQTFGIDTARLTTAGFGNTRKVADNATEDGRARNRRVELVKK